LNRTGEEQVERIKKRSKDGKRALVDMAVHLVIAVNEMERDGRVLVGQSSKTRLVAMAAVCLTREQVVERDVEKRR
jgi:hypothetical protein